MDPLHDSRRATAGRSGVSLIELLVALLLGVSLAIGAVAIYARCQRTIRVLETTARLQDVARLAFDVLENDVRMAGYWGLLNRAELIANRAGPLAVLPAPFTSLQGARIDHCGGPMSNWAIDLDRHLDGSNNVYGLSCPAFGGAPGVGTDTLVVRRAAGSPDATLDPDRIYVHASRIGGSLFVPAAGCTDPTDAGCVPAAHPPPGAQSRVLIARAYYIATQSTLRTDVPSLRRKTFGNTNAVTIANAVTDEEIVAGVEDLQIRLGVDTNGDTNADRHVNPGAVPDGAAVVSATLWLRVRAEERETGHVDSRAYQYADMVAPLTPNDSYRRIVVSKTIHLRNTRS
jgi:type IV pilus assembly protein PilW